jgi:hypothetical protein
VNTNKPTVIYHRADFDGIFCREIARKFLPDANLIGWDYADPTPEVSPDAPLYILDLSVPDLMSHPHLIWIDHHKSAIEKFPATIPGYRIDGVAACRLTWQWFLLHAAWDPRELHPLADLPAKDDYVERRVAEPLAVRLAGEYDIWDKRDPDAELFQHGLRSRELNENMWDLLLVNQAEHSDGVMDAGSITVFALLEAGQALQFARTNENASIIKTYGFTIAWEGLTFLACNHARFNSHLFIAGLTDQHDACLGFNYDGKGRWKVSLYHAPGKEHHDLSQIAVKHGGGGHRAACGFTVTKLPFELP